MLVLDYFGIFIALAISILLIATPFMKDIFVQMLFLSSATNLSILMIVILGSYQYRDSYLDIALIYAFLTFITSQGILKYIGSKKC